MVERERDAMAVSWRYGEGMQVLKVSHEVPEKGRTLMENERMLLT